MRRWVDGSAALIALLLVGLVVPAPSPEAQQPGRLELLVRDVDALRGLTDPALAKALAERLWLRVDGDERGVPVTVHGVYVERQRVGDTTVSSAFRGRSGPLVDNIAGARAGGTDELATVWPSTGGLRASGEQVRDTRRYPPREVERFVERAALEVVRRSRASAGVFLVPVAADPRLRRSTVSVGVMIPMSERRR